MISRLKELLQRVETWPQEAQEELMQAGLDIEAGHRGDVPLASEDVEALRRSAEDVRAGRFASNVRVEEVLGRRRA